MFYRRTNTESPMSRAGYAMFADSADAVSSYGENLWVITETTLTDVSVVQTLVADFFAAKEFDAEVLGLSCTAEIDEVLVALNPTQIVNSAGAWDNEDFVSWMWDNILEPNQISTIETKDGAIVFDVSVIAKM